MTKLNLSKSQAAYEAAKSVLAGGVNSPVRAFNSVGGTPPFIASASGAHITDIDGNTYIDYVGSWGPMILGHAHPQIISAVTAALTRGSSFGAPTEAETELAELIVKAFPSIERVRLVNSGTEATMSALRLARSATGRDIVVKFEGCYHGHVDALLVSAGSGAATFGHPTSAGIPQADARNTAALPYNDLNAVEQFMSERGDEVACIIVEPVAGNMGVVAPTDDFLPGLRRLCDEHDALLIFDEVMTGFRIALGGAQERYNIRADITTLGKIIGGGLPVGAYGAGADIMSNLSPLGPTYQAGTLSGNPLVTAAGIATLKLLAAKGFYDALEATSAKLAEGLREAADETSIPITLARVGSMMTLFFTDGPVTNYSQARASDAERFARFHRAMLAEGIYLPPSQFEAWFIGVAHAESDLKRTIEAVRTALETL